MKITNDEKCFVQLWLRLERTRRLLASQYKRYCIRNILKEWFGTRATDDFIWEVCNSIITDENEQPAYGWDVLPPPKLWPRKHRELLRAIVSVVLNIGIRKVDAKALNKAYEEAFPQGHKLKSDRKKKEDPPPFTPPSRAGSRYQQMKQKLSND